MTRHLGGGGHVRERKQVNPEFDSLVAFKWMGQAGLGVRDVTSNNL